MPEALARRRHALGQHFLIDPSVAARTVAAAGLTGGSTVLEIGPGRGALTDVLLASGHRVVAVELDHDLAERLRSQGRPELTVVEGDFLRLDLGRLPAGPLAVVANLPYSTGTAIVTRLLEHPESFPRLVVMLQREVAERVTAVPGSRTYGALSVLVALRAVASVVLHVPPSAFRPAPRVDSAVVRIDATPRTRVDVGDEARFRRVVRAAFAQRRKTLRNALAATFGRERAERLLEVTGVAGGRRAETLSLEEFALLSREAASLTTGAVGMSDPGGGA